MTTNSTAASPQKFLSAKFAVKATTIAALALAGSLAAVAPAAQAQRLDSHRRRPTTAASGALTDKPPSIKVVVPMCVSPRPDHKPRGW